MKRIIREQWGRWCLVFSLAWAGLLCACFPPAKDAPVEKEQQTDGSARLQVAYQPQFGTATEMVFPEGRADDYRHEGLRTWIGEGEEQGPRKPWPILDVPSRANARPIVRVLPDPGPSLEGTGRLPAEVKKGMPSLPRITSGTDAKE